MSDLALAPCPRHPDDGDVTWVPVSRGPRFPGDTPREGVLPACVRCIREDVQAGKITVNAGRRRMGYEAPPTTRVAVSVTHNDRPCATCQDLADKAIDKLLDPQGIPGTRAVSETAVSETAGTRPWRYGLRQCVAVAMIVSWIEER